jgi:hypothetical protein
LRIAGRAFVERHDTAERNTNAHLSRLWSDRDLPLNPASREGWWQGGTLGLRWNLGSDPLGLRAFGQVEMEAATGPAEYGRGWTSLGFGATLFGLSGAVEAGAGGATGSLPPQRRFFPGGPTAFRGLTAGEVAGDGFWFGRAEIGRARPGARLVGFVDWLAVGPRDSLWELNPLVAVGGGFSFLDGLIRMEVARNLRGAKDWRFLVYLVGLF